MTQLWVPPSPGTGQEFAHGCSWVPCGYFQTNVRKNVVQFLLKSNTFVPFCSRCPHCICPGCPLCPRHVAWATSRRRSASPVRPVFFHALPTWDRQTYSALFLRLISSSVMLPTLRAASRLSKQVDGTYIQRRGRRSAGMPKGCQQHPPSCGSDSVTVSIPSSDALHAPASFHFY